MSKLEEQKYSRMSTFTQTANCNTATLTGWISQIKSMQTHTHTHTHVWLFITICCRVTSDNESINSLKSLAVCSQSTGSISIELCGLLLNYCNGITLQINTNTPACLLLQYHRKTHQASMRGLHESNGNETRNLENNVVLYHQGISTLCVDV